MTVRCILLICGRLPTHRLHPERQTTLRLHPIRATAGNEPALEPYSAAADEDEDSCTRNCTESLHNTIPAVWEQTRGFRPQILLMCGFEYFFIINAMDIYGLTNLMNFNKSYFKQREIRTGL